MRAIKTTPIVSWIKRDLRAGNTPVIVFCGRPRSGKTAFAMRIMYEVLGRKFAYDNVVDSVEKFAARMKANRNNGIILDEASGSLYVYDWSSYLHRVFSIIQDSQAYRHNMVFIILPRVSKLDNVTKFDVDAIIEMKKMKVFDPLEGRVVKVFAYKYLKQIKKYSDFKNKEPILVNCGEYYGVPLPPPNLWEPYISKDQKAFKEKILDEQLELIARKAGVPVQKEKPTQLF